MEEYCIDVGEDTMGNGHSHTCVAMVTHTHVGEDTLGNGHSCQQLVQHLVGADGQLHEENYS